MIVTVGASCTLITKVRVALSACALFVSVSEAVIVTVLVPFVVGVPQIVRAAFP